MLTKRWIKLRPHEKQRRLYTSTERFVAVQAGRGSGKSEIAKRRLVRALAEKKPWDNPIYFYGGPTVEQVRRIAWNDFQALVPREWLAKPPNSSSLTISTIFGSELRLVGLDKPHRIEGVQWDGGVIDESSDIKPGTFDLSIYPTLTHKNGWCWRIGVPKRQGMGAKEFNNWMDNTAELSLEWEASTVLPPDVIARAKLMLDPKDFREQMCAKRETAGGGIFYAFDGQCHVRPCQLQPSLPIIVGSDFNIDPMAWVIGHRIDDRIEIFDELWVRDCNTKKALDILYSRYPGDYNWEFYGDASGRARKTSASMSDYLIIMGDKRFKKKTVRYPNSNPFVADRFAATNRMFKDADDNVRLHIDKSCKHLIDDLQARSYVAGTNTPADKGDIGHITDALGYIIYKLFPIVVNLETKPKVFFV